MDPSNRIGGTPPAQSAAVATSPNASSSVDSSAGSMLGPVALLLPLVTSKFTEWRESRMSSFRPMSSFLDKEKLSMPATTEIPSRIKTNLVYFQTNYILLFAILGIYCILTSPSLIFWLGLIFGAWIYVIKIRTTPFVIASYEVPERVTSAVLFALSLFIFWWASIGNTIFWMMSATVLLVGIHAFAYTPVEVDEFGFGSGLPTTMPPATALPSQV